MNSLRNLQTPLHRKIYAGDTAEFFEAKNGHSSQTLEVTIFIQKCSWIEYHRQWKVLLPQMIWKVCGFNRIVQFSAYLMARSVYWKFFFDDRIDWRYLLFATFLRFSSTILWRLLSNLSNWAVGSQRKRCNACNVASNVEKSNENWADRLTSVNLSSGEDLPEIIFK